MPFDVSLLDAINQAQDSLTKASYVPPPESPYGQALMQQEQQQQMAAGNANTQPPITDPNEAMQVAASALSQGSEPEEVYNMLLQQGLPQEMADQVIQEAMNAVAPPEQEQQEEIEPLDINKVVSEKIKEEKQKKALTPEDRLMFLEKQVETLIDLVQQIFNSQGQMKQADLEFGNATLEGMLYEKGY